MEIKFQYQETLEKHGINLETLDNVHESYKRRIAKFQKEYESGNLTKAKLEKLDKELADKFLEVHNIKDLDKIFEEQVKPEVAATTNEEELTVVIEKWSTDYQNDSDFIDLIKAKREEFIPVQTEEEAIAEIIPEIEAFTTVEEIEAFIAKHEQFKENDAFKNPVNDKFAAIKKAIKDKEEEEAKKKEKEEKPEGTPAPKDVVTDHELYIEDDNEKLAFIRSKEKTVGHILMKEIEAYLGVKPEFSIITLTSEQWDCKEVILKRHKLTRAFKIEIVSEEIA